MPHYHGLQPKDRRVMSGWPRRSRSLGAKSERNASRPARWIAKGANGAVAAVVVVLSSWLFSSASSAQIAEEAYSRAGAARAAVAWAGFAGNAQHTAVANKAAQPLKRIRWHAKVDRAPVLVGNELLIHYGSPMITGANTVLVPTRVSATAGFKVVARNGTTGARRWSLATDYRTPAFLAGAFTPPLPAALTPGNTLAVAGAGGTVLMRAHANRAVGAVQRRVFYGAAQWRAHRAAYNNAVQISTPLTAGPDGSVYFGFSVTGPTAAHLSSGIARIDARGHATWITAAAAARNPAVTGVAINCAPALSPAGTTVYITVTTPTRGILVGLDASTLQPKFHVALKDPVSGLPALISPSSSASPTVG